MDSDLVVIQEFGACKTLTEKLKSGMSLGQTRVRFLSSGAPPPTHHMASEATPERGLSEKNLLKIIR